MTCVQHNIPRVSRVGGGIGVMHKTVGRFEKHPGIVTNLKPFEFIDVLLKHSSLRSQLSKLKSIDLQELRDDISDSPLISTVDEAGHDLESMLTLYNTSLIGLLEKHAPLITRTITIRPSAPWYTEDIREEKQKRRALNDVGEGLEA